ncbi:hypothetical protein [Streptomyces hebeiensis]
MVEAAEEKRGFLRALLGRGVALPDGRVLPVSEDGLARLPLPAEYTITVAGFVEPTGVVPISCDRAYCVASAAPAVDRPYAVLLAGALGRAGRGRRSRPGAGCRPLVRVR